MGKHNKKIIFKNNKSLNLQLQSSAHITGYLLLSFSKEPKMNIETFPG